MELPQQKKILREDLKDAPGWVTPLIGVINGFMETLYLALNRNITFSQNVACFIKEVRYVTPAAYPANTEVIRFRTELKTKATGLIVLFAVDRSNYVPAAGPVYAPWVENDGEIQVGVLTGLLPNKDYTIRLLVF